MTVARYDAHVSWLFPIGVSGRVIGHDRLEEKSEVLLVPIGTCRSSCRAPSEGASGHFCPAVGSHSVGGCGIGRLVSD